MGTERGGIERVGLERVQAAMAACAEARHPGTDSGCSLAGGCEVKMVIGGRFPVAQASPPASSSTVPVRESG